MSWMLLFTLESPNVFCIFLRTTDMKEKSIWYHKERTLNKYTMVSHSWEVKERDSKEETRKQEEIGY